MLKRFNWQKWGLDFFQSLGRHIGTAGMTWLGIGIKDGAIDWNSLWVALVAGALLPTIFTFLQRNPVPDVKSVTVTTETTETTTTTKSEPERI